MQSLKALLLVFVGGRGCSYGEADASTVPPLHQLLDEGEGVCCAPFSPGVIEAHSPPVLAGTSDHLSG